MLELSDNIAAALETPIPLPASNEGHSFMAGLRSDENPLVLHHPLPPQHSCMTMAITWNRVRLATTGDQDMATLLHITECGFSQFCHELPAALQEYYQFHDHLYIMDGVILYKHPDPSTKLSPAQCVFGCPIKDFIPILPSRYQPHPTWRDT